LVGAGALTGGIVLLAVNGSSKIDQSRAGAVPQGNVRRPEWMPARDPITASIPSPTVFPLGFRF
jgi:hypothetical protein